jgi:hypothetical protein
MARVRIKILGILIGFSHHWSVAGAKIWGSLAPRTNAGRAGSSRSMSARQCPALTLVCSVDQVRGWIVEHGQAASTVTFLGDDGGKVFPVYRARFSGPGASATVERVEAAQGPTATELAMWRARKSALAVKVDRCSESYNTVVLPGDTANLSGWLVYLIPATTQPGRLLVGGSYRIHVSPQGDKVLRVTSFSKSCLAMAAPRRQAGGKAVGAFFTHLVSETPVETHVFLSKLHRQPFYVGTARGVWKVADDTITFLGKQQ